MFDQIIAGALGSILGISIHAAMTLAVIRFARALGQTLVRYPLLLIVVMIPTVTFLMATHTFEVIVWAWIYKIVGAAPPDAPLVYFAFVNYTTLGYGDVVPLPQWQLLGPITAMNGVLLFGWSTAVIFEVLRRTVRLGAAATSNTKER
jgi:ion channel